MRQDTDPLGHYERLAMNNKSQITLLVNGTKMYTRNVAAHKKYGYALVDALHPTRILSCSTSGRFDAILAGVVCTVTWTGPRHATAELHLTADQLDAAITHLNGRIANARSKSNNPLADSLAHDLKIVMDLRDNAIAATDADKAEEIETVKITRKPNEPVKYTAEDAEGMPAKKTPKAKKAKKVSTETEEKMMQRFAGQCREMIRKIGYDRVELLMQRAVTDVNNA